MLNKELKNYNAITLRISEATMKKADEVAERNAISRQKLIEAILE